MLGPDVLGVGVDGHVQDAGPALEGAHDEEREHGLGHVVVVEGVALPDALLHDGVVEVAVLVHHELALALVLCHLGLVRAHEEFTLERRGENIKT